MKLREREEMDDWMDGSPNASGPEQTAAGARAISENKGGRRDSRPGGQPEPASNAPREREREREPRRGE